MGSLYIHIPFCERKCVYCDFYSVESLHHTSEFLEALRAEIALAGTGAPDEEIGTVYFGGGTPSLLTPSQLESVLRALHATFRISPHAEVTLETNPGTVTRDRIREFRRLGVNRLSIGIQSFFEDELKFLGRIHSVDEAVECVRSAQAVGFDNVSIDLIYSLPGQRRERWEENLGQAAALSPAHVSAYSLIVEEGTPLARMVASGQVRTSSTDDEAELYACTMDFMDRSGFEHYEVSNYASPGYRSRHNMAYWSHENYLGFGPSAHSFRRSAGHCSRWANVSNISSYLERLRNHELPIVFEEKVQGDQLVNERIFLGLRSTGLGLGRLRSEFGIDIAILRAPILHGLLEEGLALIRDEVLCLTSRGFLLCDEIAGRLMV